ncbi:ferredoxin reductase family protein [Roseomonas rosulenta]|uniref:ferredoxin reductase family protein n=1 Tax=Roseomonas rosulenta TaxID=2748667 RepID=UPI0018DF3E42|nr:ferredoxin reductase family protein [Roseomonas rosulenta]
MPAALLLAAYAVLVILPVALGWARVGPARPWMDELSSALAMAGFAALLLEFLLSGRFSAISGGIGIDRTMRWHQAFARVLTVALLAHPFLYDYAAFRFAPPIPAQDLAAADPARAAVLGLTGGSAATGWIAWLMLFCLTGLAIFRRATPYTYEGWRVMHGLTAAAVALTGLLHALEAGRYSADAPLAAYWGVLTAVALFTLVEVYILRPRRLARRPWRIAAVTPAAERSWEVTLTPAGHDGLAFTPGQFAWLRLACSPHAVREHPFSIASAPGEPEGRLRFLIKEAGDFTSTIGSLPVGAPAYVDGPHGVLVTEGRAAPGIAMLAGGIGLAPMLSMLRAARTARDSRPMLLLYGNRHAGQILAREELAELARALPLEVVHVLSEPPPGWAGATGMLSRDLVRARCAEAARAGWIFVLCGPPAMLREARVGLAALGVPGSRILEERFVYD